MIGSAARPPRTVYSPAGAQPRPQPAARKGDAPYLLAAKFVLPGLGPRVDKAIEVACDLLTLGLDTRATVDVAGLGYGTPLRDAESLIRDMLDEQHVPVRSLAQARQSSFRSC
jgi:hypothetical protein